MKPTWYENACFYHINPLTFCNAPLRQDNFQAYRLQNIELWLDHLKGMGFTALYLGPVFDSLSHGYDTSDYYRVDSRLGDNQSLVNLVHACHQKDIKVILDGVFNHTGREFFAFKDIQKQGEASAYLHWYRNVKVNGNGFTYENWRGCEELAVLDLTKQEVRDYLLDVAQFWKETFHIDGIRLDCADSLDLGFLKELHTRMKTLDNDFFLLGEVIHGDYRRQNNKTMLDSVTNYELHKALYSSHNDHNLFELAFCANREFGPEGLYRDLSLYTFVDNHDVDRLASKLEDKRHLFNIYTLLFTLRGIPSVYYGSEWGIEGKKEGPDDSKLRPAVQIEDIAKGNQDLLSHIHGLITLRKTHAALVFGKYEQLYLTSNQFAFKRETEKESILVCTNAENKQSVFTLSAEKDYRYLYGLDCSFQKKGQLLEITLGPFQTLILAC
ncbi:glycosidase [Sphaerochaeta pleomorpha str. Grapes]|uniref:Glycosidase n=1 Tax=Sphaerochaeta pleomorpha (strain ATCC BAA-1885 / DSM 22778 / Grapes) TaxID=158190 RepID=G8QS19_SPHPG|nr:alpha-amylase family glycosyl hydrolase [Sphaerochaeta pleomorpha]AEV30017.1 glycosidase [Sphaerochaeta pleomorpha str. Grapes]